MTAQVVERDVGCLHGDSPANPAGKVGKLDNLIDLDAPWQNSRFFELTQFILRPVMAERDFIDDMY